MEMEMEMEVSCYVHGIAFPSCALYRAFRPLWAASRGILYQRIYIVRILTLSYAIMQIIDHPRCCFAIRCLPAATIIPLGLDKVIGRVLPVDN